MIGPQPPKARLERRSHERAVPTLRALTLRVLAPPRFEHVAELGGELYLAAVRSEHAPDELLVRTLAIGIAGLEEGDPELERLVHQALALRLADVTPPARAERPRPEADLRRLEVGIAETPSSHGAQSRYVTVSGRPATS